MSESVNDVERLEELKAEIERLEAEENLDSEEYTQLKGMRDEVKKLEEAVEAEAAKRDLVVRPLNRRDIQILQTLVKEYPGFKALGAGDQLDRIVLVLTNVCGFGGVMSSTIEAALEMASYKLNINVEEHFKSALWTNREGETRRRYVNNFAAAYKLEPGLSIKLISESKTTGVEQPIRKTVTGKKPVAVSAKPSSPEELSKQGTVRTPEKINIAATPAPQPVATAPNKKPESSSGSPSAPSESPEGDKKGIKDKFISFFKK